MIVVRATKTVNNRDARNCLVSVNLGHGEKSEDQPGKLLVLHHALAKKLVFSGEQILHKIETAFIGVARGASEMMIDPHSRRAAEIIRDGKNFVSRFTLAEQPLCVRTRRADRKQLRRSPDKSGKEQLLAIEFRAEPSHGVK